MSHVVYIRQDSCVAYFQLFLDVAYFRHYTNLVNMRHLRHQDAMRINRPADLAALVREARHRKGWTQVNLATRLEVNRDWVIRLESGEPGMAIGIVLRALRELGLELQVVSAATEAPAQPCKKPGRPQISIDEVADE